MKKLLFVSCAVFLCLITASTVYAQETKYDLLIKGGHVIDPANNINEKMDVAVRDGKIARVEKNIPATDAKKVVDVPGFYVTPGLIETHMVCYYTNLDVTSSVIADHHCLPSGVTTCCDGGTAGAANFEDFK
ncbi:MAG: amidohydrolase/deacetylase family metallohydrolase, partial [Candidatus Latescibacteria bacterium]|nr:amidohydrolase/deacetylase family metallohydrolase [Candidatus Latescibacterota bacterium]